MKHLALFVSAVCIFVPEVCNAGATSPQPSATLTFKPPATAKNQAAYSEKKAASETEHSYRKQLEKIFEKAPTSAKAFELFRKQLPIAREKGELDTLFDEYVACNAYYFRKDNLSKKKSLLHQWLKYMRTEIDEPMRMLYGVYFESLKSANASLPFQFSFFMNNKNQIRPGENLCITGNLNYSEGGRPRSERINIEVALLKLDERNKPSGAIPVVADSFTMTSSLGNEVYQHCLEKPGVYRITVFKDWHFMQSYLLVSWLDCVVKADSTMLMLFGASFKDTLPPPYSVHFTNAAGEVNTDKTDSQGVLYLKHQLGVGIDTSLTIMLEKDGNYAFVNSKIPTVHHDTTMECFSYTDRPVYRPGHRVHFQGLLKLVMDARTVAPAAVDSVDLSIFDPQGTQIRRDTLAVDDWGHFGDSVDIDESYRQGRYQIQYQGVVQRDKAHCAYRTQGNRSGFFLVDSYKKPEAATKTRHRRPVSASNQVSAVLSDWCWEQIEIHSDKKQYQIGDTARISIKTGADKVCVLCSVEGRSLNEWKTGILENHGLEYTVPITPGLGADVRFNIAYSGTEQMAGASHALNVVDSTMLLRVKIECPKRLRPGDTVKAMISVSDRQSGRPTRACMSVAMVDEAIFDLSRALEKAKVYGKNYHLDGNRDHQNVLDIIPSRCRNRVSNAENSFGKCFLFPPTKFAETSTMESILDELLDSKAMHTTPPTDFSFMEDERSRKDEETASESIVSQYVPMDELKEIGYWNPSVSIGVDGKRRLTFVMPDNFAKWRLMLRGSDGGSHLLEFRDSLNTTGRTRRVVAGNREP